jgi:AcrR family transcriptional regulator
MREVPESSDHRPTAILAAARQALLTRGLSGVRVADIAELAHVSSGSVHYHFDTKDEVLVATFRWSAEQVFAQVEAELAAADSAPAQMGRLLALSVPEGGLLRDEYVIWLQFWAEVLTRPSLLGPCEAVSERWRFYFHQVVQDGVASGAFHPICDPAEAADRLIALVDGLGFETVIGYRWTSPERMRQLLARFASEQLGVPITVEPTPASAGA